MLATYASFALLLGASVAVGQAVILTSGRRRPAAIAPAVGLAALCAVAWGTVRLPGEGTAALVALAAVAIVALVVLWGRVEAPAAALRVGAPVALGALVAASLPFIVEGRYGILGTGLNPDMSQHLFAADRLADAGSERLIAEGYPLGPHALVVALGAIGIGPVQAFNGLILATAVAAALAALSPLGRLGAGWRIGGALVVGFAYLAASYLVQGAFKETLQAVFVLAFAIALAELAARRRRAGTTGPAAGQRSWASRGRLLAAVPLGVLAAGSVYVYSFPGLAWLAGAVGVFAAVELGLAWWRGGRDAAVSLVRTAAGPAAVATLIAVVAIAPEAGRMVSFAGFETFDPDGPGLGNLFNRISPPEALGIWPSGDFRVEPGDGAAPAIAFWLGAALGLAALAAGAVRLARRRERAVPAALIAAAVLWLYAWTLGTPYQEAKALALAAPLGALVAARGLAVARSGRVREGGGDGRDRVRLALGAAFLIAAGGSSLLVLVNGPVGPSGYSPALAELRPELGPGSTLVMAPQDLLADQHGRDYLVWELRGHRICVEADDGTSRTTQSPPGIGRVLVVGGDPVEPQGMYENRSANGPGPCPLIATGDRADPAGDD